MQKSNLFFLKATTEENPLRFLPRSIKEMMKEMRLHITTNAGNSPYFYEGDLIEETDEYIKLKDKQIGEVKIFKNQIIISKEIK